MTTQSQDALGAFLTFLPDNIPVSLKLYNRWSPWVAKFNEARGKWDKIPRQVSNLAIGLSSAKPEQWAGFKIALANYQKYKDKMPDLKGLGFCITGLTDLIGIDIDGCVKAGKIAPWAMEIIRQVHSYTEFSPSGTGIRIFTNGHIDVDWVNHDKGIEVYAGHFPRFLTITGHHVEGTPTELTEVNPITMAQLSERYAKEKEVKPVDLKDQPEINEAWDILHGPLESINFSDAVRDFLLKGVIHGEDRSGLLHQAGIELYNTGMDDTDVFSVLATNQYAMDIALSHRRNNHDRALTYLWVEHCLKAKPKSSLLATTADFDAITPEPEKEYLPPFKRDKQGKPEASLLNIEMGLKSRYACGAELKLDVFIDEILISYEDPLVWVPITDSDYTRLRMNLERWGFKPISRDNIRDVVQKVAEDCQVDSAMDWLKGLKWDGVPRIDNFLINYFSADDEPYSVAVSQYLWTALAGRALKPGIKVDMVPVLVGDQGLGKSSGVQALAPSQESFAEINLMDRDDDLSRKMRGVLVAEIGELRGLSGRDAESIKAFITRTHEQWVPKYKEFAVRFPRRAVFIGTTNQDQFLADPTGNRRWLPIRVEEIDVKAIERDRDQLWAEAVERFKEKGILYKEAETLAKDKHQEFALRDSWVDVVAKWLDTPDAFDEGVRPRDKPYLKTHEVLQEAIGLDMKNIHRAQETRVGYVLKELGYERKRLRVENYREYVYVPICPYLESNVGTV